MGYRYVSDKWFALKPRTYLLGPAAELQAAGPCDIGSCESHSGGSKLQHCTGESPWNMNNAIITTDLQELFEGRMQYGFHEVFILAALWLPHCTPT